MRCRRQFGIVSRGNICSCWHNENIRRHPGIWCWYEREGADERQIHLYARMRESHKEESTAIESSLATPGWLADERSRW